MNSSRVSKDFLRLVISPHFLMPILDRFEVQGWNRFVYGLQDAFLMDASIHQLGVPEVYADVAVAVTNCLCGVPLPCESSHYESF